MMRRIIDKLVPRDSDRRMFVRVLREIASQPGTFGARINRLNAGNFLRYRRHEFSCPVCGNETTPLYDFPNLKLRREHRIGTIRETLQCRSCFSPLRERSLAYGLLGHLNARWGTQLASVRALAEHGLAGLSLLDTDNFSATSLLLRNVPGVTRCSYLPDRAWGEELWPGYYNIDLQRMDFPDSRFDVLLTSDVMEHVRDCDAAHGEIFRVLKPGGAYIFNVPYDESSPHNIKLVDTSTAEDVFLCEPQLHGDPLTGGILAYRVFGRELTESLQGLGFAVEFQRLNLADRLIVDGDVFVAHKPGERV